MPCTRSGWGYMCLCLVDKVEHECLLVVVSRVSLLCFRSRCNVGRSVHRTCHRPCVALVVRQASELDANHDVKLEAQHELGDSRTDIESGTAEEFKDVLDRTMSNDSLQG